MPIISGALWDSNNPKTQAIADKLENLTSYAIEKEKHLVKDEKLGWLIIGGKKKQEAHIEQIITYQDPAAMLIGRIFKKNGPIAPYSMEEISIREIASTNGTELGLSYWGRYILAIIDREKKSLIIFRDPVGTIPLFFLRKDEALFFSSDIALLYDAVEKDISLDWVYLASFVAGEPCITSKTPFAEITELLPGTSLTFSLKEKLKLASFWNPTTINTNTYTSEQLEPLILDQFKKCISSWTYGIDNVYLELSGGLDSSSLLVMLHHIAPDNKIEGLNLFHSSIGSSNEKNYAKEISNFCGTKLTFVDWSDNLPFSKPMPRRVNKPTTFLMEAATNKKMLSHISEIDNFEIFCGHGGDHMFQAAPSVQIIADYFLKQGINGIFGKVKAISAYQRMPLVKVLSQTLYMLYAYQRGKIENYLLSIEFQPWMKEDFKEYVSNEIFKLPFWDELQNVHPGKAKHIWSLYQALLYTDQGYRIAEKPVISPFLSQPLVELALSIPTYELYGQGYDRLPFRKAMNSFKKHPIFWRKGKGETSGVITLAITNHFNRICELALEGKFAQANLLNKNELYKHIVDAKHGKKINLWPFINLLSAEVWFESWAEL